MKRKILAIYSHHNAVEEYRTFRPLSRVKHKVTFVDYVLKKRRKVGDIAETLYKKGDIWFIKYVPDNEVSALLLSCRQILRERGKKVKLVVDLDDNVFEIPYGNIAMFFWKESKIIKMASLVKYADLVICSTNPLKDYVVKNLNEKAVVLKNCLDLNQWEENHKENDKVKIGWVYSKTHIPDIKECKKAIEEIKKEYGDKISIELFGGDKTVFDCEVVVHEPIEFRQYHYKLMRLNWDISIAPLVDNDFNRGKSNIKWLESTMAGSAFIGSRVAPYINAIKNGTTGYLCKSKAQWKKALRILINNKEKREEVRGNAYHEVIDNYNIDKEVDKYNKVFEKL